MPGDPGQVIYVWFDALCNYVTALGPGEEAYRRWWSGPGDRVHLLGKGVLRFHAVYSQAMLLSSGQPLPTAVFVHDYLTAGGRKISKSGGGAAELEPSKLADAYGADAVRWWLLREVPRAGDDDFTVGRLIARADGELANGLGNLVNRVVAMTGRYRDGRVPASPGTPWAGGERLAAACREATRRPAPPWMTSTSAGPRPRSGASSTRRTPSSTGPVPGSWPGPSGTGPARAGSRSSTRCSPSCSGPVRCSAGSWRRSCRTWPDASALSARRAVTGCCRHPPGVQEAVSAAGHGQAPRGRAGAGSAGRWRR